MGFDALRTRYNARIAGMPMVVCSFACIGGGLFGLDISNMSGMVSNPYYLARFGNTVINGAPGITSGLQGGVTASMPAGSFAGAIATSKLADVIGRKFTIILAGLIWVLGSILQGTAYSVAQLVVGRIIAGFAIGMSSSITPLYIAEIAQPAIRGRAISLQQWSITWGILIMYAITIGCAEIEGDGSFRVPWLLQLIPGAILSFGVLFFPESPRWLVDHGRSEEAHQVIADLHGKGDLQNELVTLEVTEIEEAATFDRTQAARSYMDLLKPGTLRRVFLGCCIQMWSQLSGMNVMMYYVIYVFQSAGITGRRGELISTFVQYVLNVALTVPAIIYIDRWGRRPMLFFGAIAMCVNLFIVGGLQAGFGHADRLSGSTTWVITGNTGATYAVIVFSYLFVCSFAISWGPCSWTYPAEIFPTRVRAKAVSISTSTNWIFNFALAYAAPKALENLQYQTYFLYGTFCAAAAIHIFFMYPETKGRTLEEVEEIFNSGHEFSAWKLKADLGKKTLQELERGNGPIASVGKTAGSPTLEDEKYETKHVN